MKQPDTAALDVLAPGADLAAPDQDTLLGQQLTEQYHRATTAIREVIIFGAMILKLEDHILAARGQVRTGGAKAKGTGLEAWLEKHAPDVSRGTARRWRDLAEGVREEFKLGKKVDLQLLLAASAGELESDNLRKKQSEIFDFIAGKSQRQLLLAFDKPSSRGGDQSGNDDETPPLTPEQQHELFLAAAREDFEAAAKRIDALLLNGHWKAPSIKDEELDATIAIAERFVSEAKAWLKTPQRDRTRSDAAATQED